MKPPDIDTTSFTPLELHILILLMRGNYYGLRAERTSDGLLILTAWHDTRQENVMKVAVGQIGSPDELHALHTSIETYLADRNERDRIDMRASGTSEEDICDVEAWFPYQVRVFAPAERIGKAVRNEYKAIRAAYKARGGERGTVLVLVKEEDLFDTSEGSL